jgi:sterol desaturase/sphingolipid hydroxylase (fatty acid hydroxylase superfamily)
MVMFAVESILFFIKRNQAFSAESTIIQQGAAILLCTMAESTRGGPMSLLELAVDVAIKSVPVLFVVGLAMLLERGRPIDAPRFADARLNLAYTFVYALGYTVLQQASKGLTVATVNAAGGGLIPLADHGWPLLPSFLLYLVTLDFFEYLFHRAQHRWRWLWAMHSLHHSDPAMNASTTQRHFWLEPGVKMVSIYLVAGLLFSTPPVILVLYGLVNFYHVVPHMNWRIGFGRGWWLLNSPQYHRIHHSSRQEHYNRNFAGLFPVFDLLCRTSHRPAPGEFPPTGLGPEETPASFRQTLVWPWRRLLAARIPAFKRR